jgi:hypothetical protein
MQSLTAVLPIVEDDVDDRAAECLACGMGVNEGVIQALLVI